ncbi:endonuclease/exonuclease/phosphatase family protein [Aestuariicoccus sp. MJ-SS9]|uniref:endonuclease/exonuclease/phosphatase family protein n=1 Tax=Aestuariicoccus sp. MJ-SS9 TaxID=3079855 RepID=UPI002913FCD2|nr:endonuclease/exonuclease/phosphatase family protein [Aestuariicoccus sp. MJ-SS9]MDU8913492.1 endonuclease/exonuclease/phosphatase family protein [Aestuariicoccus sp. MJ-SS9]
MRIATFNLQNLRLRQRDGRRVLEGAVDQDVPGAAPTTARDIADRRRTAEVIRDAQADIVALQEVFDAASLDFFHDRFLTEVGAPAYPHRYCLPGNDGRGLNVAALSRRRPVSVTSHAALTGAELGLTDLPPDLRDRRLFRRDCLALDFAAFAIFICHFKAPYPDEAKAHAVREAEARGVRRIVETHFAAPETARWIVLGDFNEPAGAGGAAPSALAPLTEGFAVDLLDRLTPGEDWTYEVFDTHRHSRPDRLLISPRLARDFPRVRPKIIRSGMTRAAAGMHPHASDHALVYADFPGL